MSKNVSVSPDFYKLNTIHLDSVRIQTIMLHLKYADTWKQLKVVYLKTLFEGFKINDNIENYY